MAAIKKPLHGRKGGVSNLCASASDPKVLCDALAVYGTELFKAMVIISNEARPVNAFFTSKFLLTIVCRMVFPKINPSFAPIKVDFTLKPCKNAILVLNCNGALWTVMQEIFRRMNLNVYYV